MLHDSTTWNTLFLLQYFECPLGTSGTSLLFQFPNTLMVGQIVALLTSLDAHAHAESCVFCYFLFLFPERGKPAGAEKFPLNSPNWGKGLTGKVHSVSLTGRRASKVHFSPESSESCCHSTAGKDIFFLLQPPSELQMSKDSLLYPCTSSWAPTSSQKEVQSSPGAPTNVANVWLLSHQRAPQAQATSPGEGG